MWLLSEGQEAAHQGAAAAASRVRQGRGPRQQRRASSAEIAPLRWPPSLRLQPLHQWDEWKTMPNACGAASPAGSSCHGHPSRACGPDARSLLSFQSPAQTEGDTSRSGVPAVHLKEHRRPRVCIQHHSLREGPHVERPRHDWVIEGTRFARCGHANHDKRGLLPGAYSIEVLNDELTSSWNGAGLGQKAWSCGRPDADTAGKWTNRKGDGLKRQQRHREHQDPSSHRVSLQSVPAAAEYGV